jgi:hypothetical protein
VDNETEELKSLIYENINRWKIYMQQEKEKENERIHEEKKKISDDHKNTNLDSTKTPSQFKK